MSGYEAECFTCAASVKGERRQGACSIHRFVMPAFSDYVVCRDWRSRANPEVANPFRRLQPGVLYRWRDYGREGPEAIGRFEEIREFRLDRVMQLAENPDHGWALYIDPWDHDLFPAPGTAMAITLDGMTAFSIADVPVTTTHTYSGRDRSLRMEDRTERRRIAVPAQGEAPKLLEWIERNHDVPRLRADKARNLLDPRMLNKDKVLRIMVRVVGEPLNGRYGLLPFTL